MPDGITETGFKRKRLGTILEELNADMKLVFGSNLDVSPESPNGQANGVIAKMFADLWEIAEGSYNTFNPNAAKGAALSNLVQLNNVSRSRSFPSRGFVIASGTPNTLIGENSRVSSSDTGNAFVTTSDAIIGGTGTVTIPAASVANGPVEAISGSIDTIDSPVSGWVGVTNVSDFELGSLRETDTQLRSKRKLSVSRQGSDKVSSIRAEVLAVEGVVSAIALQNDKAIVDSNGQDPYSTQAIVLGGSDIAVAEAILRKKAAGTPTFGNTTVTVQDDQGFPQDINFTRPTAIPIYVVVNVDAGNDYPADGDSQIAAAIVDYANGDLLQDRGFSLNDDVVYTELFYPANSIPNHVVTSLTIGTSPSPTGTIDVPIGADEISTFLITNVEVNS